MASTMLVRELLKSASFQLQDLLPQFDRFTQHSLVSAANDGQRVIAKYLPHSCSRVDAFKLAPGTRQSIASVPAARLLTLDGSTSVDRIGNRLIGVPVRNLGADGLTPGRAIRLGDRMTLDAADPDWHIATGAAVREVFYDALLPKIFYVSPGAPVGTDVWIELPWLPDPLEIPQSGDYSAAGASTLTLSIDDSNSDDLLNYVLARALMIDAEFTESLSAVAMHTQLFVNSINMQAVAAGLPNPKLQALPRPQPRG